MSLKNAMIITFNKIKRGARMSKQGKSFIIIFIFLTIILTSTFLAKVLIIDKNPTYRTNPKNKNKILFKEIPELPGFTTVYTNGTLGPVTVDRDLDDGTKFNIYNLMVKNNNEDFEKMYYDYDAYEELEDILHKEDEYLCEVGLPSEAVNGYQISCPLHYTLSIDNAFYGRYANDISHCAVNDKGEKIDEAKLSVQENCGKKVLDIVKKICEKRKECTIKPNRAFFSNPCKNIYKYLHVKYHCTKNKEFKKPKIAIVMFTDRISVNSIYENAISEFYQYADIHGYKFLFNNQNYDKEREIYYMKLHVINEAIIRGLKTKEYDWIFWVDSDVMLANPNLKLETFLPEDDNIHFIASSDWHGLNAGVFFIRVHPWSLNFIMRSLAYKLYNKDTYLEYEDQTSLNNVLLSDENSRKHYVIVPQYYFNAYPDKKYRGDMILHFAGRKDKKKDSCETRAELLRDPGYFSARKNDRLRKEVLAYYAKPKEEQRQLTWG